MSALAMKRATWIMGAAIIGVVSAWIVLAIRPAKTPERVWVDGRPVLRITNHGDSAAVCARQGEREEWTIPACPSGRDLSECPFWEEFNNGQIIGVVCRATSGAYTQLAITRWK